MKVITDILFNENLNESVGDESLGQTILGELDRIIKKKSLGYRCSDFQPTMSPIARLSGAIWDKDNKKLKTLIRNVEIKDEESIIIEAPFTLETMHNFKGAYGEDFQKYILEFLEDELTYKIDSKFIELCEINSVQVSPLDCSSMSLEEASFNIVTKVNKALSDLPISDNRSPYGFAIVSSDIGSLLSAVSPMNFVGEKVDNEIDNSPSYIGALAGVDYYVNFTHDNSSVNSVIAGIKGNGITRGSIINSPYSREFYEMTDPINGMKKVILHYQGAFNMNPLNNEYSQNSQQGFLAKFDVDLSTLEAFTKN